MTQTSWAARFGFSISAADREILDTQFHVHNPQALPNQRPDIPPDLEVEEIEFAYHIAAPQKHLWIRCCECGRDRNHQRGFVLRFIDQTRATLGKDCGLTKHKLNHEERINDFEGRMKRTGLLQQALAMLEQGPVIMDHLRRLRGDPAVAACLEMNAAMVRNLPDFARRLEAAAGGQISGKMKVRDWDAEKERDARLDRKLNTAARLGGRSRDEQGVDRELLAELARSGDKDASKQPVTKLETRVFHTFSGHGFFSVLPRARIRAEMLETQLLEAFSGFRGKGTANITDHAIESARKKFIAAMDATIKLTQEVEVAFSFLAPGNMAGVVRAIDRFYKAEDRRQVTFADGVLCRTHAPDLPQVDTRLPPLALALTSASLGRTRERVMDAYSAVSKAA